MQGMDEEHPQDALRVSQLDSSELDSELFELLMTEMNIAFKYFTTSSLLTKLQPEIKALLRLFLWRYTLGVADKRAATVGQRLISLRYMNTTNAESADAKWITKEQTRLYAIVTIAVPWAMQRISYYSASLPKSIYQFYYFAETFWRLSEIVNFVFFLIQGRYQHPWERFIRIRPVFSRQRLAPQVSFEYLNRELLWHGFAEFLFFLLPLIDFHKIFRFIKRCTSARIISAAKGSRQLKEFEECAVCSEWPVNPHQIGCNHVFCYYCIRSNYVSDPSYICPQCGQIVKSQSAITPILLTVQHISEDIEPSFIDAHF